MQVVIKGRNTIVVAACLFAFAAVVQIHPRRQTAAGLNSSGAPWAARRLPAALSAAGVQPEDWRLSQHSLGPAMAALTHYLRCFAGVPLSNGEWSASYVEKIPFRIRPPPAA